MDSSEKAYISHNSGSRRRTNYPISFNGAPIYNGYQYSPPAYQGVIHHSPNRYYNYPMANSPEIIYSNHRQQFIHPKGTIPPESVIKVKDDGEVKFESEKENEEKFEEKFIVNRPPEKKIFEEIVEHEIEVDQPPYIEYEEKKIEKVIEIPRSPAKRIIQEIIEREIEIPVPPEYKTITETIKVPVRKVRDPEKKKVQEVVTKEIVVQPPPQEITIERVIQEKVRPVGIKATGHHKAYIEEEEIVPIQTYSPVRKIYYGPSQYSPSKGIEYARPQYINYVQSPQPAYISRTSTKSPYIEASPIREYSRPYISSPIRYFGRLNQERSYTEYKNAENWSSPLRKYN